MDYLDAVNVFNSDENLESHTSVFSSKRLASKTFTGNAKPRKPLFSNAVLDALQVDIKSTLKPSLKEVCLAREQFLYQEEDPMEFIYFPVTAVISEFKTLNDGRMVEISVTGNEGAVGLSSLYSSPRTSSNCMQVVQAGTAFKLDVYTLEKLRISNENFRRGLRCDMDRWVRQISQKAICNMYHSVKERLCTWLLMLKDRTDNGVLSLTHEQIARTLGVLRPSVTWIAQELRTERLISYSRGNISILDRNRIERTACSCYRELRDVAIQS